MDDYKLPALYFVIPIVAGLTLMTLCYLTPNLVPYAYLGPVGTAANYFVQEHPFVVTLIFYLAWALHLAEAVFAWNFCKKNNISGATKWTASVFIFGVFSFKDLKALKRSKGN